MIGLSNMTLNISGLAGHAPAVLTTETLSVKQLCYGIAGANLLIIIGVLVAINFLSSFFWRWLDHFDLKIFGTSIKLWRFLPVINYMALIIIFVYIWNLF